MKQGIHPENYRPVVFKDMSNGDMFLTKSTCKTNDTVEFEGETYPVVKVAISSTSHPFYSCIYVLPPAFFYPFPCFLLFPFKSCYSLPRTFISFPHAFLLFPPTFLPFCYRYFIFIS